MGEIFIPRFIMEPMVIFIAWSKVYYIEYFCNTTSGNWGGRNFCPLEIFGCMVHVYYISITLLHPSATGFWKQMEDRIVSNTTKWSDVSADNLQEKQNNIPSWWFFNQCIGLVSRTLPAFQCIFENIYWGDKAINNFLHKAHFLAALCVSRGVELTWFIRRGEKSKFNFSLSSEITCINSQLTN